MSQTALAGFGMRPAAQPPALLELLDSHVRQRPTAVAVADAAGDRWTYAELGRRSDAVAARLFQAGARVDDVVALAADSHTGLIAAMLGVLKAGAAYLPLSPADPDERLAELVRDAGARIVLADAGQTGRFASTGALVLDLGAAHSGAGQPPAVAVPDSALAYVIYTSGSTGRPKGVGVSRANLHSYVDQITAAIGPAPGDVFSMLQPATFDSCLTMLYPALATGGTLWVVPSKQATDADWVAAHLRDAEVDHVKITPSHLAALHDAGNPADLMPRKNLIFGGEPSNWAWFTELGRLRPGCRIVNHYGPTETTAGVAALVDASLVSAPAVRTPLGPAMRHADLYVLDDRLNPVGPGETGELCIGGDTVSRGYLGRPGLTAAAFRPDPNRPGGRIYRTGDLVRCRPDGLLDFLGRADDQVKIRGHRIEPAEAAYVLSGHPDVEEAVVVAQPDPATGHRLAAHLKAAPTLDLAQVRAYAAARLPEYLVPELYAVTDAYPLTRHGKLDRAALPVLFDAAETPAANAAQGPTEEAVARIFGELLKLDTVGRDDAFFALGGHSLLVAKLISRLRSTFETEIPVRSVFEAPTVAGLAERIDAGKQRTRDKLPPVRRLPRTGDPLPASFGQQRLWFLNQLDPGSPLYNTNFGLRALGFVDADVLRRTVHAIVMRHEVLRTRLLPGGESVVQVIDPDPQIPYELADLRDLSEQARAIEVARRFREYTETPFDLTRDIPIRILHVILEDDEHLLLLSMHHVATEGPSMLILHRELAAAYPAVRDGRPIPLEPLAAQYADYAGWQREMLAGDAWSRQLDYWRQQLAGLPPRVELPTDFPRPSEASPAGGRVRFTVPGQLADRLRELGLQTGATLFMTLLSGLLSALHEQTPQHDVAIGIPVAFRPRPELESTIGFFGNTLVLRNELDGDVTYRQLLKQVRGTTLSAIANRDLPFEALVEELAPRRNLGDTPLVNIMLVVVDEERPPIVLDEVTFQAEPIDTFTAKSDLVVLFEVAADGLAGEIEYRTDLFRHETVQGLAERLEEVLAIVAARPDTPIKDLVHPAAPRELPVGDPDAYAPGEYVEPETDLERELCRLWIELTGNDDIGATDNFFVVGGHSLMAAQVVQRIGQWYGVTMPLRWCFDIPTVRQLSLAVLAAQLEALGDIERLLDTVTTEESE
jgi:amino acid adenylation domain-containing protein